MAWVLFLVVLQSPPGGVGPSGTPDVVVRNLYAHIVKARPIGIPTGTDRAVLWPLLTGRLVAVLETARRCEEDYFRRHPDRDLKPDFGWIETGLFSGPDEMALPSLVQIIRTDTIGRLRYLVLVEFTYRELFETYGRPPDPRNTFQWRGEVTVDGATGRFLVDEFRRVDNGSGERARALSEQFVGCRGTRWVGD
jgi:hypothetical protein